MSKLKVYLSRSNTYEEYAFIKYKIILENMGYEVIAHNKQTGYDSRLLPKADFVCFLQNNHFRKNTYEGNPLGQSFMMGKGQTQEAEYCVKTNTPAFLLRGHLDFADTLLYFKLAVPGEYKIPPINIVDPDSWVKNYAEITFYTRDKGAHLGDFIEGFFRSKSRRVQGIQIPDTEEEFLLLLTNYSPVFTL